jgi:CorA-like Mg2+ transporter protein
LVLVDAPIRDAFIVEGKSTVPGKEIVMLDQRPFQGGTEEFTDPPSYSKYLREPPKSKNESLFDDLVCYLQVYPPGFDVSKPSLLSLAYYPLKIATSEWLNYTTLMSHCVKHYEYSFQDLHLRLKDTALLDADLRDLQNWRRRGTQALQKLRTGSEFTKYWSSKETKPETEAWDLMIKDFDYITVMVEAYSRQLEAMVPVVTSLVQILDSRQSFAEAANIKQLTYVALVFVPLSFVATLFSMSDNFIPGGRGFWIYFAVAIPLSMLVLALSHFSLADTSRTSSHVQAWWSSVKNSARIWSEGKREQLTPPA